MNKTYSGKERREYERKEVKFTALCEIDHPAYAYMTIGNKKADVLMFDLSEKGMSISTNCNIPLFTPIGLEFTLIDLNAYGEERVKHMKVSGEVRSNILLKKNERRLGILFTSIKEEDLIAITGFIKRNK